MIRSLTAWTTATLLGSFAIAASAQAQTFGNVEINQDAVVPVVAQGSGFIPYRLYVYEQVSSTQQCWSESGTEPITVDPLLLEFDFSGICNRAADTNGYSVRVNNQDLGSRFQLRVVETQDGDLLLRAVSNTEGSFTIGSTGGKGSNGYTRIVLAPGWRLTKRTFDNQVQGHYYFTNDTTLAEVLSGSDTPVVVNPTPDPINPPTEPVSDPVLPPPPVVVGSDPLLPPPPGGEAVAYRVIVPASDEATLSRVRTVEPGAFRTTVNGQSVIQAGIYQERPRAEIMQQNLGQAGLAAQILNSSEPIPPVVERPTTPVPQTGVVVVIDPGHGGRDPGAIGIGGLQEKEINLAIAIRVQQILEENGVQAPITRTGDQTLDLDPRVQIANRANATLFVSIHSNAISLSRPEVNGLETYYYSTGASLARTIHNSILQRIDIRDRGVRQARFYVLRYTDMPSVLVETGFVTGSEDAARLRDPAHRNAMADAIAQGILNYVRGSL
ncbi:MAG: N-acetylmuramoyl-L-alanine amidase [Cyanobacteria bacterium J06635_15]